MRNLPRGRRGSRAALCSRSELGALTLHRHAFVLCPPQRPFACCFERHKALAAAAFEGGSLMRGDQRKGLFPEFSGENPAPLRRGLTSPSEQKQRRLREKRRPLVLVTGNSKRRIRPRPRTRS